MELKDSVKEIIARVESRGDVKAVFGEPVKEGGLIVIPVASLCLIGGGLRSGDGSKAFGLGKKKQARPVGYIKIKNGQVKFEPIADWQRIISYAIPLFGLGALLMTKLMLLKMKLRRWENATC